MTEQLSANDRRTDIINNLQIRLSVLEATHNSLLNTGLTHAALIDKLSNQDTTLVISLNSISIKFDDLIKQISVGIKIVLICTSVLSAIIAAFYSYSKDLDSRYAPKLESIVSNTVQQKSKIDATSKTVTENAAKLHEQASKIEDVSGQVDEVTGDVKAIKKLKAVRGSR
jgi:methyl-accepting chemotaxis protein